MSRGKTSLILYAWPLLLLMALVFTCVLRPVVAHADPGDADLSAADALTTQAGGAVSGTWGTCPWTIDAEGTLTVSPGTGETQDSCYSSPWGNYSASIKKVVFAAGTNGGKVVAPENLQFLFYMMENLTTVDLRGMDASGVESLANVFANCAALKSIDVTGLNTSNVKNITALFSGCTNLVSVAGFESLDLSNASSLFSTFYGCASLPAIELPCLVGARITNGNSAFEGCSSAVSIDLSGVDTTGMTSAECMFYNCSALTTVYVGDKWSVASLYDGFDTKMFVGCTSIKGEKGTTYDQSYAASQRAHVDGGESNPGYLTYKKAVEKKSLATATVTLSATDFTYNGAAQKPTVKSVVLDGTTLKENADFTVAYSNNNPTDVGSYTVTVTGTGDYKDSKQVQFAISAKSIAAASVTLSPTSYVYNATAREPGVKVVLDGVTLTRGTDFTVAYTDNKNVGTATATITGAGNYKDSTKATFTITKAPEPGPGPGPGPGPEPDPDPDPDKGQVMRRLYNPYSYEHFYTAAEEEFAGLVALGWIDEGEGWTAPLASDTPVYRVYNPNNGGDHHYTTNADERDALVDAGWADEGTGWYSAADTGVPVYREYNPNELVRNHNYTKDKDEHDGLVAIGWQNEDIAWYGM